MYPVRLLSNHIFSLLLKKLKNNIKQEESCIPIIPYNLLCHWAPLFVYANKMLTRIKLARNHFVEMSVFVLSSKLIQKCYEFSK
jgi:hypothetical protein